MLGALLATQMTPFTAAPAQAASLFDFSVWMRGIDNRSVSVQRHIAARNVDAARTDARELERLYALMEDWFVRDGHSHDAVQISREGKELAAAILPAIERQEFDRAASAALTIARACNDCHDVYKPFNN